MKRSIGALLAGAFAAQLMPAGAWGADCANRADSAALKMAALQQELMVAALSCHDVALYNDFVLSHQPELIASDATLKAFFVRRGGGKRGEEGYHTYKTELANSASLRSIRETDSFCAAAADEFDASRDSGGLSSLVDAHRWADADTYAVCPGEMIRTADASPPPREAWSGRRDRRFGSAPSYRDADDGAARHSQAGTRDDAAYNAPAPHRPIDSDP